jgi:hypothetical protein
MRIFRDCPLALLAAAVVGLGCTEPQHTAVYEVATKLDAFTFEIGAGPPPWPCSSSMMYCTIVRPDSLGRLAGTFTTDETVSGTPTITATMTGQFCSNYDLTGCLAVGPSFTVTFTDPGTYRAAGSAWLRGPGDGSTADVLSLSDITVTPDSMFGKVYWSLSMNRSPPSHQGTFVARRVR